jgi:prepilin-type N-terminal cleavage/methylation domain-containing protein
MKSNLRAGFTLIELMVVVAVILIISSLAIPMMMGAKLSANETAAMGVMRALSTSQALLTATPQIDTDGDGAGEYGYFAEMAGSIPARVTAGGLPAAGAAGVDELVPSALLSALGQVKNGEVIRSGYVFQVWLPAASVAGAVAGIPEDPGGGKVAAPFPDSDNCETMWCAYGWPFQRGSTGNVAFFVNQTGAIMQTANRSGAGTLYDGVGGGPNFDAAFQVAGDMGGEIAIGVPAADGNLWVPSK